MAICLSTNGVNTFYEGSAPRRVLVATLTGLDVIERAEPGVPWRRAEHMLDGLHVSSLLLEPKHQGLFAGIHNGGLYFSSTEGKSWSKRTDGLSIEHVFSLRAVDEPSGVAIFAGTEPVSVFKSQDYGTTWRELPAVRGVPGAEKWNFPGPPHIAHTKTMAFDPRDSRVFYVGVEQGALLKTIDGGQSWTSLNAYSNPDEIWHQDVHQIVLRPTNPDEVYLTSGQGLYHSADGGRHWTRLTTRDFRVGYPDQLLFSPEDDQTLFMSGARSDPSTWHTSHHAEATVMRSHDGGRTWHEAANGLPADSRANIEAMSLAAYPGGFAILAGTTDGEVFITEDSAESWQVLVSGLAPVSKGRHFRNLQAAAA